MFNIFKQKKILQYEIQDNFYNNFNIQLNFANFSKTFFFFLFFFFPPESSLNLTST